MDNLYFDVHADDEYDFRIWRAPLQQMCDSAPRCTHWESENCLAVLDKHLVQYHR